MKKLLLILSLFALLLSCAKDEGMGVENQPLPEEFTYKVSVDQALKNLDIALANIDGETRSAKRSVKSIERVKASQVMDLTRSADIPQLEDLLYVVSFGEGQGSAVLGADKRVSPVLAIFDETVFEAEDFNRPETRSEIADEGEVRDVETEEELEEFIAGMISDGARAELYDWGVAPVDSLPSTPNLPPPFHQMHLVKDTTITYICQKAPMLNTKWRQGEPYNNSCPPYRYGSHKAAGCTVIAIGQFLNYHQWPNPNIMNGVSFDWELIGQNYYGGSPSDSAIQEVADYIYNIGRYIGADYDNYEVYESGAPLTLLDNMLVDYGVSSTASFIGIGSSSYTTAKNTIMNNGPFCMQGTNNTNSGAHAWVADGWKEYVTTITHTWYNNSTGAIEAQMEVSSETSILMHCNMGWGGKCDGYYNGTIVGFDATTPLNEEYVDTNIGDYQGTNLDSNFTHSFYMVKY